MHVNWIEVSTVSIRNKVSFLIEDVKKIGCNDDHLRGLKAL